MSEMDGVLKRDEIEREIFSKVFLFEFENFYAKFTFSKLWNKNIFPGWTKLNGEVRAKYVGKGN